MFVLSDYAKRKFFSMAVSPVLSTPPRSDSISSYDARRPISRRASSDMASNSAAV